MLVAKGVDPSKPVRFYSYRPTPFRYLILPIYAMVFLDELG